MFATFIRSVKLHIKKKKKKKKLNLSYGGCLDVAERLSTKSHQAVWHCHFFQEEMVQGKKSGWESSDELSQI